MNASNLPGPPPGGFNAYPPRCPADWKARADHDWIEVFNDTTLKPVKKFCSNCGAEQDLRPLTVIETPEAPEELKARPGLRARVIKEGESKPSEEFLFSAPVPEDVKRDIRDDIERAWERNKAMKTHHETMMSKLEGLLEKVQKQNAQLRAEHEKLKAELERLEKSVRGAAQPDAGSPMESFIRLLGEVSPGEREKDPVQDIYRRREEEMICLICNRPAHFPVPCSDEVEDDFWQ